jgi:hypothetical protein
MGVEGNDAKNARRRAQAVSGRLIQQLSTRKHIPRNFLNHAQAFEPCGQRAGRAFGGKRGRPTSAVSHV